MCTAVRDSHSPGPMSSPSGGLNPISSAIDMPWTFARRATNGKSNQSPLYVTYTPGLTARMWAKKWVKRAASLGTLATSNGPGKSAFGVYSKSATSAPTTSRLHTR
jgi:hypothetical protein